MHVVGKHTFKVQRGIETQLSFFTYQFAISILRSTFGIKYNKMATPMS